MQRRAPRAGVTGVGAAFQQKQRHVGMTAIDSHKQRGGVGIGDEPRAGVRVAADALRRRFVDVRAGGQQQPGRVDVPLLRGE